ncbi:MAG TPA: hypothetical protein VL651_02300 [Bacteroidia bacterium]|jgi:hypothetical protein|nr:hypothetical protein [Bacteroidia bacterium]
MNYSLNSETSAAETRRRGDCAENSALPLRLCASAAKILLFFITFFVSENSLFAGPPSSKLGGPKYGFSYSAEGVIPLFQTDLRHSEKAVPRPGFGAEFRVHLYPDSRAHIQIGMEIMSQACSFNTYYFAPGYSTIYDRSFGYTHSLRTMEFYIPILGRIGLTPNEPSARNIFYVMAGYGLKMILAANTKIVDAEGTNIWGGPTTLVYENYFMGPQVGNVLMAGFGLDKRLGYSERFLTFECMFRYNLSRFIYYGKVNTNELLIKNMCISLQIGYRFAAGRRAKSL